jgi:hypothetical protein
METRISLYGNLALNGGICNLNTKIPGGVKQNREFERHLERRDCTVKQKLITIRRSQSLQMTDCAGLQYGWRLRLSRLNMTDFDLAKYDWRRRECGGGSDDDFKVDDSGDGHSVVDVEL